MMVIVGCPPVVAVLASLATVVLLQWVWRAHGTSLLTVYAVNFVALAGVWLHVEAVVRTRYHDYVMEDLYRQYGRYYFNRPYLQSPLRDKEYAITYLTNRDGYRIGTSHAPEHSVEEVDWLFLGDSYTQGAQVEFEELYTSRLYHQFPDRVVLNAGVSGWGLYESLAFLRARGTRLRPTVVFIQIANFNDFMKVAPRRAGLSDYLMQASEAVRLLLQNIKYKNPTSLPLGRWVEPFYATDEENRRYNVFYTPSSPEKDRDLAAVRTVLGELAATCRELGARLVLVQLPTKEQVSFRYLEEAVAGLRIDPRFLDMERPNQLVHSVADSLGVPVIDPLEAWRRSPVFPFFHYDEHLNAEGHEMLASAIGGFLRQSGERTPVRLLSTSFSGDRYPQFVPSGDTIVFHSPRDGNSELLHADTATWTETRLTLDDAWESHPILLPNGGGLVFVVGDAETGSTRLWRSDRDGRGAVPLEPRQTDFASIPAAFPDGESLVFPRWGPTPDAKRIQLTRLHLRDGRREALPQSTDEAWRPAVDPTGRYVAYIGRVEGQYDLFELDLETRTTKRLTSTAFDEWDPAYSPDGQSIIFAAKAEGNWDLMRLSRMGGASRRLTRTKGNEWDPQVSPDGRTIAYGGEYGLMRGIYLLPFAR
jgi:lysophospholipase L1-like esterase